jgi:hypothetical protein
MMAAQGLSDDPLSRDRELAQPETSPPRISVLMAVYNGERHVAEATESILGQTFADFEFLIIDDGSTDGTRAILESYRDSRIRVVANEENLGLACSLNRGIALARGEFIARQDADDVSESMRLEKQITFFEAHSEVTLLGTWAKTIDGQGAVRGKIIHPHDCLNLRWALLFFCPFLHSAAMWRRRLVREVIGDYNETLTYSLDYDLWSRIAEHFPIANLREYLVRYRLHESSMTSTYGEKTREGPRLRAARIARLMGWHALDVEQSEQKRGGMDALYFEWPADPEVLLGGTDDLFRLHNAFCEAEGLSPADSAAHHRALRTRVARFLVMRASADIGATGAQRRALLQRALGVFPAIYLRPWTALRAVSALLAGYLPRGARVRAESTSTGASRG